ncbi:hypothetical protein ABVK25_010063 [Lepraria finkii]|uniref:NADP-dependent oxidoreductase domain-containing protein n=1 Tax=Lepraria finkii TaxID=1340010 RepID=A0ABR4AVM5_9LECA
MQISEDKGYVKPTVYQGQYNLLCRRPEQDLIPTPRKYGMVYNAYSLLAGGFLTDKATAGLVAGTRFEPGKKMGAAHTNWYDKPIMHDAVRNLQKAIEPLGLTLTEVSMRRLVHYSALGEGDGVIIGGSRFEHIGGNVKDVKRGPLPKELVEEIDEMWEMMKDEAP